ncbi:MAG: spermidine/putrescine ABC transporter permease PotC, partial [Maritimibacter sp.]
MAKPTREFNVRFLPGITPLALLGFLFLYMPLGVLIFYSFSGDDVLGHWGGFSWRWYVSTVHNEMIREAAGRSVLIATIAAGIDVSFATMAAIATTRSTSFKSSKWIYMVISQPLMVPEIV